MLKKLVAIAAAASLIAGCSAPSLPGLSGSGESEAVANETVAVSLAGKIFQLEVADSPAERELGLMQRGSLAADTGMLFIFDQPQQASFWMKNTQIPLDLLLFDADRGFVEASLSMQPCAPDWVEACPVFASKSDKIKFAIELPAGTAASMPLPAGTRFEYLAAE